MTDTDREMIKAMAFIKEYCKNIGNVDGCRNCPMFDNCDREDDNTLYPYYWYIPEV